MFRRGRVQSGHGRGTLRKAYGVVGYRKTGVRRGRGTECLVSSRGTTALSLDVAEEYLLAAGFPLSQRSFLFLLHLCLLVDILVAFILHGRLFLHFCKEQCQLNASAQCWAVLEWPLPIVIGNEHYRGIETCSIKLSWCYK